ncbi:hypothetical protein [Streptosporangium sp. V21-05]|uniref:hypothetical protein n=1 Tax=Streptosporangium sp. V21-05 TaxID=3446115 RepID=UPI003F52F009
MSGRRRGNGHRAVLPPADFQTTPQLTPDGLEVTVINKGGHARVFDFGELKVPAPMQRSLARTFAAQSRTWTGHASANSYWNSVLAFDRFLDAQGHPAQDLDELTSATLRLWRNNHKETAGGRNSMTQMRTLLKRDRRLAVGLAAEELARRVPSRGSSKQSYEGPERERMVLAAERQFRAALLRIRENTVLLEQWRAAEFTERSREGRIGAVLDHLAKTGDVPRTVHTSGQSSVTNTTLLGGAGALVTWGRLFLTRQELTALAVMLTDRFAWNLSMFDRVPVPVRTPSAGETTTITYQVQVEKRRAGGGRWFSTENITDSGADSPGRLITKALEATAHGRALAARLAPGIDLLMVGRSQQPNRAGNDLDRPPRVGPLAFGVSSDDGKWWGRSHGLGGSPFQRSRRTTVTQEGRPLQHSRGTHESVYILPDKNVQKAARSVIAAGAEEALNQARDTTFKGRLTDAAAPDHQETATADCANEETSPWPAPGGGCGADFLLCLACPNSRVHSGHHSRLAYLHRQLTALRSAWPEEMWRGRWDDHLQRLDDLRDKIRTLAWDAALARVTSTDRTIVDLLLKGQLAP